MEENQVILYYEEMRNTFVKPDSSWADKATIFRTLLEKFFTALTPELEPGASLFDRIEAYYDSNPEEDAMRGNAHRVRKVTNEITHNRVCIGSKGINRANVSKETIRRVYEDMVLIVFNATGRMPDDGTFELLGVRAADYLKGLNDQQKEAILCDERIVFVDAGPGTGKTHLLVHRLVHQIHKYPEQAGLVALSFTNTAALSLGEKFQKLAFFHTHGRDFQFYNGTIHSFCLRKMRKYHRMNNTPFDYIIIGDDDFFEIAPEISAASGGVYTVEQVRNLLKTGKSEWPPELLAAIDKVKSNYKLISINDILTVFLEHLDNDPVFAQWLMESVDLVTIDEAQDLSEDNFRILDRMLELKPSLKLFLVGDPRQNIFEFNGGSCRHLDGFLERHHDESTRKYLSVSYRCPEPVLRFVNAIEFNDCTNIALSSGLEGSILVTPCPDTIRESEHVMQGILSSGELNDCAVLSSTIKGLSRLIDDLNAQGIPYIVYGGRRRVKAHIRLINNLFKIILNNKDRNIRAVAKILEIDVSTQPVNAPRHFSAKELFYMTPYGRRLRALIKEYSVQEWSMPVLLNRLVEIFVPETIKNDPVVKEDFSKLSRLLSGYRSVKEYIDAFSVFKERFLAFYEKDFKECVSPIEDRWVTLSTIHSAKGLEWRHVFVIGMYELNFPGVVKYKNMTLKDHDRYINGKKKEMYVAATRSSDTLEFTWPEIVEEQQQSPSRFLPSA